MIILYLVGIYLILGFLFSIAFVLKWIHVIDDASDETPWTFKLTILPGCVVFWPVLFRKYLEAKNNKNG